MFFETLTTEKSATAQESGNRIVSDQDQSANWPIPPVLGKGPGLVRALNCADARWRRNFLAVLGGGSGGGGSAAAAQLTEAMIVRGHRVAA